MGTAVLTMHMSLDGIVTHEDRWMTFNDEMLEEYLDYYDRIDRIVVGGNTYAQLAEYWQHAEQSSGSELERSIAKKINDIPKSVFSRTVKTLIWRNSEQILIADERSFVQEMRALINAGGTISVESGLNTWQLFLRHRLYDELWMFVHPAVAAEGERLFESSGKPDALRLIGSKAYRNGVVGLYYSRT